MKHRVPFPLWALAILLTLASAFLPLCSQAQTVIENVIVETYYIADSNDATDTIGGGLAEGSRTFRVYIDLAPGYALRAIYGRADHPVIISSTDVFFNHLDRGRTFGHQINTSTLGQGTVSLDSWLALGGASNQRRGVLKASDPDGSVVGGTNNNGGSAGIPGGLLVNAVPELGIPLTEKDGLHPTELAPVLPPNFLVFGDDPNHAFRDSTLESTFESINFRMGCSTPGVRGPTADNQLLVAQLTTLGELTFELNIEVEREDGALLRFVARDTLLETNETANGLLSYPPRCGCTDPNFLEYESSAGCDDGTCQTTIVFGCLDPEACNFDPGANFSVPQLCCYSPTNCNGLDVALICPGVSVPEVEPSYQQIIIYPNPVEADLLYLDSPVAFIESVLIHDMCGRLVSRFEVFPSPGTLIIPMQALITGMYQLTIVTRTGNVLRRVVRN